MESKKKLARMQEVHVAKTLGFRRQANSGSTPFAKGDVIGGRFLIECKTHVSEVKGYKVERSVIDKMREEAFGMGLSKSDAVLCFNFGAGGENFYVLSERLFKELINGKYRK